MSLVLPPDLTALQTAIWLDQQLYSGQADLQHRSVCFDPGPLRFDLFEAALRKTVAESPGLRLPPRSDDPAFDLTLLDFRKEKDPLAAAQVWMRARWVGRYRWTIRRYFDSRSFGSATSTRSGFRNFTTSSWTQPAGSSSARGPRAAIVHCVLTSLCRHSTPRHPKNCLTPNGGTLSRQDYAADRAYWLEQFAQWPGPLLDANRQKTERASSGRPARNAFTLKRDDFTRLEKASRQVRIHRRLASSSH